MRRALFDAQGRSDTNKRSFGRFMTSGMDPEDDIAYVQMMPYFGDAVKSKSMSDTLFIVHIPRLPADWMPHGFHFDGIENVGPCFARGVAKVYAFEITGRPQAQRRAMGGIIGGVDDGIDVEV